MSQQAAFIVPGTVTKTSVDRSKPLSEAKIAERLQAGKFRRVKADEKKSQSNLAANLKSVTANIRKQASLWNADNENSTICYDTTAMIAGNFSEITAFINARAGVIYDTGYLAQGYLSVFNKYWLNDAMDEIIDEDSMFNRIKQFGLMEGKSDPEISNFVNLSIAFYRQFFNNQELIKQASAGKKSSTKKLNFEEVTAELGILVDRRVVKGLQKWLKANPLTGTSSARKITTRKSHSVEKYFFSEIAGNHIYITLSRDKTGASKLSVSHGPKKERSPTVNVFEMFPEVHFKNAATARLVINDLVNNPALTEEMLKKFTGTQFHVLDTDSAEVKLAKFNAFIDYMNNALRAFEYKITQAGVPTNLAYNQQVANVGQTMNAFEANNAANMLFKR